MPDPVSAAVSPADSAFPAGATPARHPDLFHADASLLLIVDLQERLLPGIAGGAAIADRCGLLIRAAGLFGVPVTVTQQYPRGLGPTVPALAEPLAAVPHDRRDKTRFSAAPATGWPPAAARDDNRFQVIVAGIETHICILQTAFDLLALGYRVAVPADAVGSRRNPDHAAALSRLRDAGATVTTAESLLFEWCEDAADPRFRALRDLVTGR